jgi:hypothetical protein
MLAVTLLAVAVVGLGVIGVAGPVSADGSARTATVPAPGLWLGGADGGVFSFGAATFHGSAAGTELNRPMVGVAATPDGGGYWLVAADGGVFAYGDATFDGSAAGQPLNQPVVGMAATPDGGGYWLVAADGGVFAYGDATFYGSAATRSLNQPVVGMVATPDGGGYWLVAADGGVFAYGDATFHGSAATHALNQPVVGMAADPGTGGYWLVGADGGVFAFDAPFDGAAVGDQPEPVVGMAAAPGGRGYWLATTTGVVVAEGTATSVGTLVDQGTHVSDVVGITSPVSGGGAPVLGGITPDHGPATGGTLVTITGEHFTGVTEITFNGRPATSLHVLSDASLTAVTPSGAVGGATVGVFSPNGGATGIGLYRYLGPPPTVTSLSPTNGPVGGSTAVTIIGTNLDHASAVTFGGVHAPDVTSVSNTEVIALTPPHDQGLVDVAVTTPSGTGTAHDAFFYSDCNGPRHGEQITIHVC